MQNQGKEKPTARWLTRDDYGYLVNFGSDEPLMKAAGIDNFSPLVANSWLTVGRIYGIFAEDRMVGMCLALPRGAQVEIGYALKPAFRGRGLMTMAVQTVMKTFAHQKLVATTKESNQASNALLKRCGFTKDGVRFGEVHWYYQFQVA